MKENSIYFNFKELSKPIGKVTAFNFIGWSGLYVVKFFIPKGERITNFLIDEFYPDINKKEKIFFTTDGNIKFKSIEFQSAFDKFDAINIISEAQNYNFESLKDTNIFMISSKESKVYNEKPFFFNFKKDIEARDLWGGKIISRPYEGKELTLVLFDIKPEFKFEDKGHANEQITWLTQGEMSFYANGKKKILKSDLGVSIGSNHLHGGISNGALGFDAFFPKRIEAKYTRSTK